MTSFNSLSNEIKTIILEFLQLPGHASSSPLYKHHVYECRDALVALCLVSRDVYSLAMPVLYDSVYRPKTSGKSECYLTRADLQSFNAPFQHTRSIAIDATGMTNIANTLWSAGFRTKLRKLVILQSPWTLQEIIGQLSIAFKDLSSLVVYLNKAIVGERAPSPARDKVPLPLRKLQQLTAANTELSHLYHTYHVDIPTLSIYYDSASPKESLWGIEGGPSEFFAKEALPIDSLTLSARWTPSLAVLPAALEVLCLTEIPMTLALHQTINALPNLQVLDVSSRGDQSFLRQLPGGLTHFFYHADRSDEIWTALDEISRSDGLAGRDDLYVMIVLDEEAFGAMTPAQCRAFTVDIQQDVQTIQNRNEKVTVDVFEILQHYALCEKQWPYPFGTFDHTGRRLLFPDSSQEVPYAVDRLCKFARGVNGLLQYMNSSWYGTLKARLADDLAVGFRVGDHLVKVLEANGYIMRADDDWLAGALDDDTTDSHLTSWLPTPKLFSEYCARMDIVEPQ